jgi:glycosyltransferase involved in cell wall biosynthesis
MTNSLQPKFSLITVTFNSEEFIQDCLESVKLQDYPNIEYIIIDGNSEDNTLEIIQKFQDITSIIISEPDNGLYHAMNKGINRATGDFIGFLNSDDIFSHEKCISKIVKCFEDNPNAGIVYADLYYVKRNNTSKIDRIWKNGEQKSFKYGWHPAHPTFYAKRSVYREFGTFNLNLRLAADFELMLRFLEKEKISSFYLKEFLVKMRLGGITSKSFKNIILQNIECVNSFSYNGIKINSFLYVFTRIFKKIIQKFH